MYIGQDQQDVQDREKPIRVFQNDFYRFKTVVQMRCKAPNLKYIQQNAVNQGVKSPVGANETESSEWILGDSVDTESRINLYFVFFFRSILYILSNLTEPTGRFDFVCRGVRMF